MELKRRWSNCIYKCRYMLNVHFWRGLGEIIVEKTIFFRRALWRACCTAIAIFFLAAFVNAELMEFAGRAKEKFLIFLLGPFIGALASQPWSRNWANNFATDLGDLLATVIPDWREKHIMDSEKEMTRSIPNWREKHIKDLEHEISRVEELQIWAILRAARDIGEHISEDEINTIKNEMASQHEDDARTAVSNYLERRRHDGEGLSEG